MLEELNIQNFAIIDSLELNFDTGLNIITGETGAGKSIIIDAVELLIGGKADSGSIRSGAERAVVEGVFALDKHTRPLVLPILEREELLGEDSKGEYVILYREIRTNGRSIARVNGVSVRQEVLREIGDTLVDIHGQSEHMSLFDNKQHLDLLDRYADLLEVREALATLVHNLNDIRREMRSLQEDKDALKRRAEQLRSEVEQIDEAELKPGEDDELVAERKRIANSEQLANLATNIVALLNGDDNISDDLPAVDRLMQVSTHLSKLATIDPELKEWYDIAEDISAQAQELAIEMAGYAETVEFDPERLEEIEERIELINRLKRRYGATIEAILDHADSGRTELSGLEHSEERLEELQAKETDLLQHIGEMAANISEVRQKTGRQLSRRIMRELTDLRMERATFEVAVNHTEDASGCFVGDQRFAFDTTGIDKVEFMLSANPGEPVRPLTKVASGGEAARIMLALKRVLTSADHTPTLIFDEVDQGIGGRLGTIVGEKLWSLTKGHQVMVVTHLPQLAGFADRHYQVSKQATSDRTTTAIYQLDEDARIKELSAMLGIDSEGSLQNARDILSEARTRKGIVEAEVESESTSDQPNLQ